MLAELRGSTVGRWREAEFDPIGSAVRRSPNTTAKSEVIELGVGNDVDKTVDLRAQATPDSYAAALVRALAEVCILEE